MDPFAEERTLPWASCRPLAQASPGFPLQERVTCPQCSSKNDREIFRLDNVQAFEDRQGDNRFLHRVVSCESCGLLHTNPWFTAKGDAYLWGKAGMSYGRPDTAERVEWVLRRDEPFKTLLDVGCADGGFIRACPPEIECTGIDKDERLIETARRESPGSRFVRMNFSEVDSLGVFDRITMFHVLEHFERPGMVLEALHDRLSPAGRLVIEVPVLDRAFEMQGDDVSGFFSVFHRIHFSKNSLKYLLGCHGWKIEEAEDIAGYNGYRLLVRPGRNDTVPPGDADWQNARAYLAHRKQSIAKIQERLSAIPRHRKIIVWGAGLHTEFLFKETKFFESSREFLIVDNDPLKWKTRWHGIPVVSPEGFPEGFAKRTDFQVVISSFVWEGVLCRALLEHGVSPEQVTRLYGSHR